MQAETFDGRFSEPEDFNEDKMKALLTNKEIKRLFVFDQSSKEAQQAQRRYKGKPYFFSGK